MKVYLDHAATTPLHPKVLEKMLPYLKEEFGNPSSIHSYGRKTRVVIEEARETVAEFINADASEIYFTSSGTEANNFIIRGITETVFIETGRNKIISSKSEHLSVLDQIRALNIKNFIASLLSTQNDGRIDLKELESEIEPSLSLVSLIHTNNETGAINNFGTIPAELAKQNMFFHTDAVQAFGKTLIDVKQCGISALSASAHKINGPKGAGFAYVKSGVPMSPLIFGGSQERNRRGGTENTAAIAGFAEAVRLAKSSINDRYEHVSALKKIMTAGISNIDSKGIIINSEANSSPYILSITFDSSYYKNDAESMLIYLDINGVSASNGAACSSGTLKPSHVILSMNKKVSDANGTIRFSFGPENNRDEINYTLEVLQKMSAKFRK